MLTRWWSYQVHFLISAGIAEADGGAKFRSYLVTKRSTGQIKSRKWGWMKSQMITKVVFFLCGLWITWANFKRPLSVDYIVVLKGKSEDHRSHKDTSCWDHEWLFIVPINTVDVKIFTLNVGPKSHANPSDCCWETSVRTKVMVRLASPSNTSQGVLPPTAFTLLIHSRGAWQNHSVNWAALTLIHHDI